HLELRSASPAVFFGRMKLPRRAIPGFRSTTSPGRAWSRAACNPSLLEASSTRPLPRGIDVSTRFCGIAGGLGPEAGPCGPISAGRRWAAGAVPKRSAIAGPPIPISSISSQTDTKVSLCLLLPTDSFIRLLARSVEQSNQIYYDAPVIELIG